MTEDYSNFKKHQINVFIGQANIAITMAGIAACLLFLIYYNSPAQIFISYWFAFYSLLFMCRYVVIHKFNKLPANKRNHQAILAFYNITTISVGLFWSCAGIYLLDIIIFSENIYFILLLGGLVAGAVSTNIILLSVYFAFIIPATAPIIIYLFTQPSGEFQAAGFVLLLFVSFISIIANRLHKIITESLSYRFDNLQLLEDLEKEKNRVTELYSNLEFDLAQREKTEEQLKNEKERAEELANTLMAISNLDGLTGIANRRNFDSTLANEWNRATRSGTPISLIMCDIDYFKSYNDHYGHQKGDNCLIQIASTLQNHARRDNDLAARYGGEEFAIILPATNLDNARELAEQMLMAIREINIVHHFSKVDNIVTSSFGVATLIPKREQQSKVLVSYADRALYKAKQHGRNQVYVSQFELLENHSDISNLSA
ncbi:MAG: diguanylate cyclase [Gammaproteobacteria bacterium]|nr:diguanylate cyclase [Gammaproteobacteria bacterium]